MWLALGLGILVFFAVYFASKRQRAKANRPDHLGDKILRWLGYTWAFVAFTPIPFVIAFPSLGDRLSALWESNGEIFAMVILGGFGIAMVITFIAWIKRKLDG